MAVSIVRRSNGNSQRTFHVGTMPYTSIMPPRMTEATAKSARPERTAEIGSRTLAK